MELPEVKIATTFFAVEQCALCGRGLGQRHPVPTAYAVESIEAELPPVPVCDFCIEKRYPDLHGELLAERRRFYAS